MADRRGLAPVAGAGLLGAGLMAVAATREWATARADAAGIPVEAAATGAESQPLVAALSLVALGAWGAVLVLRGRSRRLVSVVGLLASVGGLLTAVLAFTSVQDDARELAIAKGATGDVFDSSLGPWYFLTLAGAGLAAVAFAVAVQRSPHWPAMGARYDAPVGRPGDPAAVLEDGDMWRALDEGRDPTS